MKNTSRKTAPLVDVTGYVPNGMRIGAALAWRFIAVIAALWVLVWLVGYFSHLTIPIAIALLLAALMAPGVSRLVRWKVPRGLATAIIMIVGLALVGGVLTFVISQFSAGLPDLQDKVADSLDQIKNWLATGPLHLNQEQIQSALDTAIKTIKENQDTITTGAISTAATVGEVLTGLLLTLFILIFFLYDGDGMWRFFVKVMSTNVRDRVDVAGRRGFASLVSYVRATALVAVVDAVGIGVGLLIVDVPLAVPLAALVFLGAFIPIIGAVVAGTVAVLVALVTLGFVPALVVMAIVVGVQQLESHILQPILLGRAVQLHPLAVVLAIGAGVIASGIAGALLAVPLLAVLNSGIRSLLSSREQQPEEVDVTSDEAAEPKGG
ncbi:putative PurR-regulated permease PerM [Herbihabitans rhizosphaerae]|uniref:Putative PurR-regulated permease PerM n=1 Tax=Herbihabitans rhizosphaerae TaxID=1872711 RepID=A0A4Q7KPP4_9PSEU|nr:AI-2E family transporter [Herbihabitans rhizosphaerae]RZS37661.1 putative PurR-regulated permease PerM [Herbihabitans rhizosphaerae]